MNSNQNITTTGKVTAGTAASQPTDLTRLQEVAAALGGKADTAHQHTTSDITDLAVELPALVTPLVLDTGGLFADPAGPGAGQIILKVRLKDTSIQQDAGGLFVSFSGVMRPGDPISVAQITDWEPEFLAELTDSLVNTASVSQGAASGVLWFDVRLKANAGLYADGNGLGINFGFGAGQAAPGSAVAPAVALAHNPVTLATSQSLTWFLSNQLLSAEVTLAPARGLMLGPSGVQVDFGTGHYQAASGDHTHAQLHDAATVQSSATIALAIAGQQISGAVVLDPSPPAGSAVIVAGANGIYVPLGSGVNQPSPGQHGHAVATAALDGFMAKTDKAALDNLVATFGPGEAVIGLIARDRLTVILDNPSGTRPLPLGWRDFSIMPYSGVITGWQIIADQAGSVVVDVQRCPAAGFPGSFASIAGSEKPTLASAQLNQNLAVTTWTPTLNPNDVIGFNVTSASGAVRRVKVQLLFTRV